MKAITRFALMFTEVPDSTLKILNNWLDTMPASKRELGRVDTIEFIRFICWHGKLKDFDLLAFDFSDKNLLEYREKLEKADWLSSARLSLKIRTARELMKYLKTYKLAVKQ